MTRTKTTRPTETKYLVIIRGKGTPNETRILTDIPVYWSATHQMWMTIPTDEKAEAS